MYVYSTFHCKRENLICSNRVAPESRNEPIAISCMMSQTSSHPLKVVVIYGRLLSKEVLNIRRKQIIWWGEELWNSITIGKSNKILKFPLKLWLFSNFHIKNWSSKTDVWLGGRGSDETYESRQGGERDSKIRKKQAYPDNPSSNSPTLSPGICLF